MDTKKIIKHFSKKEDKRSVCYKISEALQNYFIEDIPEETMLEVIQELNELVKLGVEPIKYEHAGDGEYTISTPFHEMHSKLQALTYLYPKDETVQEYLDKLVNSYSEDEQTFDYYYRRKKREIFNYLPDIKLTPEIHAVFMEKYFTDNNIPFHPSFLVFKNFEKLVNNLSSDSKDIEQLQKFWLENSKVLTTSCSNPDIWNIPELYVNFGKDLKISSNINRANNLMIVETRSRIAKKLFKNFLNKPEMQDKLSERFPLFFKFSSWLKPIDIKGLHYQFEDQHINILSNYKDRGNYASYISNAFSIKMNEYDKYNILLTKIAQKASLYTKLFDNHEDENRIFNNCYSLSELLKKSLSEKYDKNTFYTNPKEHKELFMKFVDTLIVEAEHDELQKELPINSSIETKRIKI